MVRDIQHHLQATLGTALSHETISTITDAVAEEVKAWQARLPADSRDVVPDRWPSSTSRDATSCAGTTR